AWYAIDDVLGFVTDRKIMNGYADGTFGPHDRITRGQAATVQHNLAGKPAATSTKFKDVNYNEYYGPAIAWARAEGIISGYGSSNTFGPNNYVTREEFAALLTTYAR
ncbi:S-layer homology domain-containing protein, partial [Adlercreutzia equolifaciens]|uniref:S-layer homology domain-containing protein n=1 Tax=Adlercreutzia equolifaciens TaxID=446660 RepID=UPI0023B1EA74